MALDPDSGFELSPDDQRVLDDLVDRGFDRAALETMPLSDLRRAEKLLELFGLLHDYPVDDASDELVRMTLDRVDYARSHDVHGGLSPDDQRIVDELVAQRFHPDSLHAMPTGDRRRADAVLGLLGLLDAYPVEDADDTLVHATMAGIDRHETRRAERMKLPAQDRTALAGGARWRFPLPSFVSVAAVLLIAASVLLPILNSLHQQQQEIRSRNNLRYVSHAVDSYAQDNGGTVPTARAGLHESLWGAFTDAVNLTPVVEQQYCRLAAPPARSDHAALAPGWCQSDLILFIGDRNPFIEAIQQGRFHAPVKVTLQQGGLDRAAVTTDAAILWLDQYRFTRDENLWRPRAMMWMQEDIRHDAPKR